MTEQPRPKTQITDATGQAVAANVRRLREQRGMSTYELSRKLKEAGRPIAASAIAKLERAERRVDVGDLVTLAVALRVNPSALLLPLEDAPEKTIELTGRGAVSAADAWAWADGERPLDLDESRSSTDMLDFDLYARPPRRRRAQRAPMPLTPEVMQYVQDLAKEGRSGLVQSWPDESGGTNG